MRFFLLVSVLSAWSLLALQACGGGRPFVEYRDRALRPGVDFDSIQTAHKVDDRSPNTHRTGFHWHLYAVNAPMAWRISRGAPDVVVAAVDIWTDTLDAHPDLHPTSSPDGSGNLIISNGSDGSVKSMPLRGGHGLTVIGMAVAEGAPDTGEPPANEGPMIGISPESRGLALRSEHDVLRVDTDLTPNGRRALPAVCNVSLVDFSRENYRAIVEAGVVVVSAAGNSRKLPQFAEARDTVADGERVRIHYPRILYPAGFAFPDSAAPQDPLRDVKILAVGGVRDGDVTCSDSSICGGEFYGCRYNYGWSWRGPLQFVDNWNFSVGTDKFNSDPDPDVRILARERAFIDIVAPSNPLMSLSGDSATYGFSSGTSQGSPLVAGVAALMLSIDRTLGLPGGFDSAGVFSGGAALQRRAYDILTFTAEKIDDTCNMFYRFSPTYGYFARDYRDRKVFMALDNMDGSPIQYKYQTQVNDPLRRSWAQRVGFGMVDAYRATAHAIPLKAPPEFTRSGALDFSGATRNSDGRQLMHMGAWRPAAGGTGHAAVLDAGGVSLPGEIHNNQGLTTLRGDIELEVDGDDKLLAIDGIVRADASRTKPGITSRNGAVIMAAGMLDNVRLEGRLTIGDLIVATNNVENQPPSIAAAGDYSEVFGELVLQQSVNMAILDGSTTIHPGARITARGENDIRVKQDARLHMRYSSQIKQLANAGARIVLEDGATLECEGIVNLHITVELLPGAELRLSPGAKVSCDSVRIHPGARVVLADDSHWALRRGVSCAGEIVNPADVPVNKCSISGSFPEIDIDIDRVRCEGVTAAATIHLDGTESRAAMKLNNLQADALSLEYSGGVDIELRGAHVDMPRAFAGELQAILQADERSGGRASITLRESTFSLSGESDKEDLLRTALYIRSGDSYTGEAVRTVGLEQTVLRAGKQQGRQD